MVDRGFALGQGALVDVAARTVLITDSAVKLGQEHHDALCTEAAAINQRLTTVEAENRRLRQALEEAEDKLEAITSIERDIRLQDQ